MTRLLLILLIILILCISIRPYVITGAKIEKFDDGLVISDHASRVFQGQLMRQEIVPPTPPAPAPVQIAPAPAPQVRNVTPPQSVVRQAPQIYNPRTPTPRRQQSQPMQIVQIPVNRPNEPIPLNPCSCDCDALQRKVDTDCAEIQIQADACQLRLQEMMNTCTSEKNQLQIQYTQKMEPLQTELMEKTQMMVLTKQELDNCIMENQRLSKANLQLLEENKKMRDDIIPLQDAIAKAMVDVTQCQEDYNKFERSFAEQVVKFNDAMSGVKMTEEVGKRIEALKPEFETKLKGAISESAQKTVKDSVSKYEKQLQQLESAQQQFQKQLQGLQNMQQPKK